MSAEILPFVPRPVPMDLADMERRLLGPRGRRRASNDNEKS